jgi:phosphatidate cytidylyltransferase
VTDKNKNLALRLLSAAVLLPGILWLLHQGSWWSAGLIGVAAALAAFEYYGIVFKALAPAAWVGVAAAGLMPLLPVYSPAHAPELAVGLIAAVFFTGWGWHLLAGPLSDAPTRAAHLVSGLVYAGLGLTLLSSLRTGPRGLMWIYVALIITWANDTCAYFAGRFLGRHKLYPQVSPNKTWEGFAGGLVGSVGGLFIAKATGAPALTVLDCVAVGVAGGIAGPIGDLCESMLKRAYDVKDSGKTIPGHGGMLDRIDALLFNAPVVFVYATYLRSLLH